MKIAIIGAGSQGVGLAGLLVSEPDVESILLADAFPAALGSAKNNLALVKDRTKCPEIRYETVDASDVDSVANLIKGYDIVFEAILPIYNVPVMKACLKAGCHYLDLIAAPAEGPGISKDETIGAQIELSDKFQKAGLTAIPSVGMSPGWTSLAAQSVIDKLDKVNDVILRWFDWIDSEEWIAPINAYFLWLEWFGGPGAMQTVHGVPQEVDLVSHAEEFEFPAPIGKKKIYTVSSHPDIVIIPKFAGKPMNICEEKGGWGFQDRPMEDLWIGAIQKVTSKHDGSPVNDMLEEFSKPFLLPTEYNRLYDEGKIHNHAVCFSCEVNGWKDGGYVRHIQYYLALLDVARKHLPWASPAVYGTVGGMPIELVLMLGRGEIKQKGVYTVGELGIADRLNKGMAARGQVLTEMIIRPTE